LAAVNLELPSLGQVCNTRPLVCPMLCGRLICWPAIAKADAHARSIACGAPGLFAWLARNEAASIASRWGNVSAAPSASAIFKQSSITCQAGRLVASVASRSSAAPSGVTSNGPMRLLFAVRGLPPPTPCPDFGFFAFAIAAPSIHAPIAEKKCKGKFFI
jgi:hypothetical protein